MRVTVSPAAGGMWCVQVIAAGLRGAPFIVSDRDHRTLYGARMAARQARIDYSPGGRLYAKGGK